MSKYDDYIDCCIQSENDSRIGHFLTNSDKMFDQAKVDKTQFKERVEILKREIQDVGRQCIHL